MSFGHPRPPQSNIYSAQFRAVMNEIVDKLRFQYGAFKWELEYGETPQSPDRITLFVNLWVEGKPILPMMKDFDIPDDPTALQGAWREMFKLFTKAINAGLLSKFESRLVVARAEREKNLEATRPIQQVDSDGSKRLHSGSDGLRKDEARRDGDS